MAESPAFQLTELLFEFALKRQVKYKEKNKKKKKKRGKQILSYENNKQTYNLKQINKETMREF